MGRTLTALCAGIVLAFALVTGGDTHAMSDPTPRTDRFFADAPRDVTRIARQIELAEVPDASALEALAAEKDGAGLDQRYGENITLLFHALNTANIGAIEALLKAGADVRVPDKPGGGRDFIFYMTSPGGDLLSAGDLAQVIAAYLDAGGDPNARLTGDSRTSRKIMLDAVVQMGNDAAVPVLLDGGADPWGQEIKNGQPTGETAVITAALLQSYDVVEMFIERGDLTGRSQVELELFFASIGGYAQRGDETSLRIRELTKRVLKRNPDYRPPENGQGTQRIFKDHYNDPGVGEIPWDEILSDQVD